MLQKMFLCIVKKFTNVSKPRSHPTKTPNEFEIASPLLSTLPSLGRTATRRLDDAVFFVFPALLAISCQDERSGVAKRISRSPSFTFAQAMNVRERIDTRRDGR